MLWLLLGLTAALSQSFADLFSKRALSDADPYIVMLAFQLYALPVLALIFLLSGLPEITAGFFTALLVSGTLNILAVALYIKAFQHADLSLVAPLIAFTPLFLLLTSPLILGEMPGVRGLAGVAAIVAGAYVLNAHERGILAPIKALVRERGSRYMLLAAFVFSITSNYDKIGVQSSSPFFWSFANGTYIMAGLFLLAFWKRRRQLGTVVKRAKRLAPIGTFVAFTVTAQMVAIELAFVAYVIALKRLSTLLSALWGWLILHERHPAERLAAAALMVAGAALIALA